MYDKQIKKGLKMKVYKIIGNDDYLLTEDLKVLVFKENKKPLEETINKVKISLFGLKERFVNKKWLMLLAIYNIMLPEEYIDRIFDIDFKDFKPPTITYPDNHIVIFKKPIYHSVYKDLRMIPRFPNYFISKSGVLYNNKTGKFIKPTNINNGYYPTISINDQAGRYSSRSQALHRLVAFAWLENTDYTKYNILDHIDGNKQNYQVNNLRWVSYKQNNNFVYEQRLKSDNFPVIIRNIDTGEITKHDTLTKACLYMGRSRINTEHQPLDKDKIWKGKLGRFEIKKENDPREWFYTENTKNIRLHVNTADITIIINGITTKYKSWKDVKINLLNLKPELSIGVDRIVRKIKNIYPTAVVEYHLKNGVLGTDGITIYKANSTADMSKKTGVPKSTIIKYMSLHKAYGKWKFKVDDGNENFENIKDYSIPKNISRKIQILDKSSGKVFIFNSLREAELCKDLTITRKYISKYLSNNGEYENDKYTFKYV